MKLGAAIKDARKRAGLRQGDLAARTDLTQSYLSQIESGKKEPHLSKLRRIADVLEIPVQVLLFFSMEPGDIKPEQREAYSRIYPRFRKILEREFSGAGKDHSSES